MRNGYKILVRKPEGKKIPLRRPGCKWEDNITIDLKETVCVKLWTGFIWLRTGASDRFL